MTRYANVEARFDSKIFKGKSDQDKVELTVNLSPQIIQYVNLEDLADTMKHVTKTKGEHAKYKPKIRLATLL
jgi:hypothetical protein